MQTQQDQVLLLTGVCGNIVARRVLNTVLHWAESNVTVLQEEKLEREEQKSQGRLLVCYVRDNEETVHLEDSLASKGFGVMKQNVIQDLEENCRRLGVRVIK